MYEVKNNVEVMRGLKTNAEHVNVYKHGKHRHKKSLYKHLSPVWPAGKNHIPLLFPADSTSFLEPLIKLALNHCMSLLN